MKYSCVIKNIFIASILAGSMLGISSCNKNITIDSNLVAKQENNWKTLEDARGAVIGMYGLLRAALAKDDAYWLWGELRNGDFKATTRPDLNAIINDNLLATYQALETGSDWRPFYAVIGSCNSVIENIDKCEADIRYNDLYYNVDVAQARALRAFTYFLMVRIWGDVPLIITTNEGKAFDKIAKTPQSQVLSFAETELIAVAPDLPFSYSGEDLEFKFPSNYYGRSEADWSNRLFSRLSAYAALAHIAAWQGRYLDVATYTNFVINNADKANILPANVSQLISGTDVFSSGAGNYRKIIGFGFDKDGGETSIDGHIENLTLANTSAFAMSKALPDIYMPKEAVLNTFNESGDDRFSTEVPTGGFFENYNAEIPVFTKIRVIDGGTSVGKFAVYNSAIVFTRLEEMYLLRAEAFAVLNRLSEAAASVNQVRSNRGLPGVPQNDRETLIAAIFKERDRELMGEGWHWFDLIRKEKLLHNNTKIATLINNDGIYWPISQQVLNANTAISQNAHWVK